ncbi:MAG: hypothetical protein ABIG68_13535 [Acidobacteriota bacterium]
MDHIHDVLSAILRTAVEWGHFAENPARGVHLPKLRTVRSKWVLTAGQAARLLERLPPLPRGMVATRAARRAAVPTGGRVRSGKPVSPNNILRRWVFPACAALNLRNATWLTFRRTYSSWAHDKGVPGKVVAQLMGQAKVDTTLNVYTQMFNESLRSTVETVGGELFSIVQWPAGASALIH